MKPKRSNKKAPSNKKVPGKVKQPDSGVNALSISCFDGNYPFLQNDYEPLDRLVYIRYASQGVEKRSSQYLPHMRFIIDYYKHMAKAHLGNEPSVLEIIRFAVFDVQATASYKKNLMFEKEIRAADPQIEKGWGDRLIRNICGAITHLCSFST
jgi:hypothetical protein